MRFMSFCSLLITFIVCIRLRLLMSCVECFPNLTTDATTPIMSWSHVVRMLKQCVTLVFNAAIPLVYLSVKVKWLRGVLLILLKIILQVVKFLICQPQCRYFNLTFVSFILCFIISLSTFLSVHVYPNKRNCFLTSYYVEMNMYLTIWSTYGLRVE